jgi:hypothetical protein
LLHLRRIFFFELFDIWTFGLDRFLDSVRVKEVFLVNHLDIIRNEVLLRHLGSLEVLSESLMLLDHLLLRL